MFNKNTDMSQDGHNSLRNAREIHFVNKLRPLLVVSVSMCVCVCVCVCVCTHAQWCPIVCNPMVCTCQAPLSMEFSRQEYWSSLPFSTYGIFLTQGSNPGIWHLLHWQVDSLPPMPLENESNSKQRVSHPKTSTAHTQLSSVLGICWSMNWCADQWIG